MARSILEGYQKVAQARNIFLSAEIEDGLTMKAVPREIELVIQHLVDNAIKYNKDNDRYRGRIHVESEPDKSTSFSLVLSCKE